MADDTPPEWAMRKVRAAMSSAGYTEASPGWIEAAEAALARALDAVRRDAVEEAANKLETKGFGGMAARVVRGLLVSVKQRSNSATPLMIKVGVLIHREDDCQDDETLVTKIWDAMETARVSDLAYQEPSK